MVRTKTGWGTEYGEYGSPFSNKGAAMDLAAELRIGGYDMVAVYECKIIAINRLATEPCARRIPAMRKWGLTQGAWV